MDMKISETMAGNTQFKVEVSAMDTNSSDGTVIEFSNYHLTRDKVMRKVVLSQRYDYAGLDKYFLNIVEELQNSEIMPFGETFERR